MGKVFTNMIKKLNLKLRSSLIQTEICAKLEKMGYKPIEIPSKYLPRKRENLKRISKLLLKLLLKVLNLFMKC
jgi:hypothetical protein